MMIRLAVIIKPMKKVLEIKKIKVIINLLLIIIAFD